MRALIARDLADAAIVAAAFAIGKPALSFIHYFDTCRRKRNVIDYMHASVATPEGPVLSRTRRSVGSV